MSATLTSAGDVRAMKDLSARRGTNGLTQAQEGEAAVANPRFEIRRKRGGQFHFVLIGGNGQVVATSETYTTKARAKSGIASVQKIAAAAEILDLAEDARKP